MTTGTVTTNTLSVDGGSVFSFAGQVTGTGMIRVSNGTGDGIGQTFTGTVTLTGNAESVSLNGGTMYANGKLSGSAADVRLLNESWLGGTGTIKGVTGFGFGVNHNQIRPGTAAAPGTSP